MADVEAAIATVAACKSIMLTLTSLALTAYQYPQTSTAVVDGATFDFIIAGSGAGGSTMANRLTENANTSVALIECGGVPPLESRLAGLFPLIPLSAYDHNDTSLNDLYACQNLLNGVVGLTSGNVLGGCSSLDHLIYARGCKTDYDRWVNATNDCSLSFDNLLQYFIKSVNLQATDVLEAFPSYYGTEGPLGLTRETSDVNINILSAFEEMGTPTILDTSEECLGALEPLLLIADSYRQSAAETYLSQAKSRSNLYVKMNTCVDKIIFDANNTATGVQMTTSDGSSITIYARKEVIVSAGALHSPKLLIHSGIGDKTDLTNLGITPIVDLPVGKNLRDHVVAPLFFTLGEGTPVTSSDPHKFPVPMTMGYSALNKSQGYADYQTINLVFPPNSTGLIELLSSVFSFKNDFCQSCYNANKENNLLFVIVNKLHPESSGQVWMNSTDPTANPVVNLGLYSNQADLENMGKYLADFIPIVNSTSFKSVNSRLVNLDFTNCTGYDADSTNLEFWKCLALETSSSLWHYCGTCAMGSVVDSELKVIGLENVRVVDASVMPVPIGGNIISAIYALAERTADLVKEKWNIA